jgi:excisionase family DNA binding protein
MKNAPMGYIQKAAAAKLMGCTIRSIDNWMKAGLIDFYKFGRAVYFKESDLMQAVESRKVARKAEDGYKVV